MQKNFCFAALLLLAASCSVENGSEGVEQQDGIAEVRVRVNDFAMSVEDFPGTSAMRRAGQDLSSYTGIKAVMLAFYDGDGNEVYKSEQINGDANTYPTSFGNFSFGLPLGSYTMVAVGRGNYEGDVFTLTSPTVAAYTSERPRETFVHTEAVNITSNTAVDLSVTLNRICSKLDLLTTDNKPTGVTKIRVTYSAGGKGFNPTTGLATDNSGFASVHNSIGASGAPALAKGYMFLSTDEQSMTVTIEALNDNDAVLYSREITNVPFRRNRVTKLRGALFTESPVGASFTVEPDWLTEETYNF